MGLRSRTGRRSALVIVLVAAGLIGSAGAAVAGTPNEAAPSAAATGWRLQHVPNPLQELDDVQCPSTTFCSALGFSVHNGRGFERRYSRKGTSWLRDDVPFRSRGNLNELACGSPRLCQVVSYRERPDTQNFYRWDGTSWTPYAKLPATFSVTDASCVGTTFCLAVGRGNGSYPSRGVYVVNKRVVVDRIGVASQFNSVSCASSEFCVLTGHYHARTGGPRLQFVALWNGTKLTRVAAPPGDVTSIDCPSTTYCMAVSYGHQGATPKEWVAPTWTWHGPGTPWVTHSLATPAPGHQPKINDVDCTRRTFCAAVGFDSPLGPVKGRAVIETWNGTIWQHAHAPNVGGPSASNELYSVSCGRTTGCTAVGAALNSRGGFDAIAMADPGAGRP